MHNTMQVTQAYFLQTATRCMKCEQHHKKLLHAKTYKGTSMRLHERLPVDAAVAYKGDICSEYRSSWLKVH